MNQLRLEWTRYPDGFVAAVAACGLTPAQLRHYAAQVGIRDLGTEFRPMLLATREQHEDLLCLLESAGYEIESDEILMPLTAKKESEYNFAEYEE